jgi:hypothetical protein
MSWHEILAASALENRYRKFAGRGGGGFDSANGCHHTNKIRDERSRQRAGSHRDQRY